MSAKASSLAVSIMLLTALAAGTLEAQDPIYAPADKIGPQGNLVEDGAFGASVAVYGDLAVVGAPGGNAAFVYTKTSDGWLLEAEILPPEYTGDPLDVDYDDFGASVGLSGNVAVIGAPRARIFAASLWREEGAACIFRRSPDGVWELEQELTVYHMDYLGDTHFGASVAISDQTVVIGAPDDTRASEPAESGSAFVFSWTGAVWHLDQRLISPYQAAEDHFGAAVDVFLDTAVVGVPDDEVSFYTDAGRAYVFTRSGGSWSQTWEFTANVPGASDHFGSAVSVTGTRALIGAPGDDHAAGADAGSAHLFTGSGASWSRTAELTASDGDAGDLFGTAVSVNFFDDVLVGSPYHNLGMLGIDAGAAYFFEEVHSLWVEDEKVVGPGTGISATFGAAVSVDIGIALIGAPGDTAGNVAGSGSAHLFDHDGSWWKDEESFHGHWGTGLYDQHFGYSMAVDGDTMVVGAPESEHRSAQVFVRDGDEWVFQQNLPSPEGAVFDDQFGFDVDVSGHTAVVGARWGSCPVIGHCGRAYVFIRTTTLTGPLWELQQILEPSDAESSQDFGYSVDVDGDTLVVGSPTRASGGGAYVLTRSGSLWTEDSILESTDLEPDDRFGSEVRLSGDLLAVGAPRDDDASENSGAVRLYNRVGSVWSEGQKLVAASPEAGAAFGIDIDIDVGSSTMVIGASNTEVSGHTYAGAAHVFTESGGVWSEEQRLVSSAPGEHDRFGGECLIFGDTAVIAAPFWDFASFTNAGSVDVFHRSGSVWTLSQSLKGSPIQDSAHFGWSLAPTGDGFMSGAYYEDYLPVGRGAVYFYTGTFDRADLSVSVTDGQTEAVPGTPITYTIMVTNQGPNDALGATVTDCLPTDLSNCSWVCVASSGGACGEPGPVAGDLIDNPSFLVNGRVDYTVDCFIDPAAGDGDLVTTATVAPPSGVADPNQLDNTDSDTNTLTPIADLSITKDNGVTEIMHRETTTYTIEAANAGPSDAPGTGVTDLFPLALTNCSWTCTPDPGASCWPGSVGDIDNSADLPVGTSVSYVATCTVRATYGQCSNTATVFAQSGSFGIIDPNLTNNEATDIDDVVPNPALIFYDGFEGGSTTMWDSTTP